MATLRQGAAFGRIPTAGKPLFSFRFRANTILRLTDEVSGNFRGGGFQAAITVSHHDIGILVQQRMAKVIQDRVSQGGRVQGSRDDHGAGALVEAVLHRDNRFVNSSGLKVGIPSWLDKSPARLYWRQIEEGAPERRVRGWFYFPGGPHRADAGMRGQHLRFFESRASKSPPASIGPFPAFRYGDEGRRYGLAIDKVPIYQKNLKAAGITLRAGAFR